MAIKKVEMSIQRILDEYFALRGEEKRIKSRLTYLSGEIKKYAEDNGVKDDKGSYYSENESYVFGKQAKKQVSFDVEKAITFLKAKGFSDCVKTREIIDEDAVEAHINSGDISYDELEGITVTKVTYAVDVRQKEEMPEVEQTTVSIAASKKSTRTPRGGI